MNPQNLCIRCAVPDAYPMKPLLHFTVGLNGVYQRDVYFCEDCAVHREVADALGRVAIALLENEQKTR